MSGAASVRRALEALGKRRLVLGIHDASFPGALDADPGRGTPYSAAAGDFIRFVADLGFDGVMLGPQGLTSRDNASPYDGTLFSRNTLNIDFASLAGDAEWAAVAERAAARPPPRREGLARTLHGPVHEATARSLRALHDALAAARARGDAGAADRGLAAFRAANAAWLEDDALYFALSERNGARHQRDWPDPVERALLDPPSGREAAFADRARALRAELAVDIERHALGQHLVHRQHAGFRERVNGLGLRLYGDLQIGLSPCDEWQMQPLLLDGYRLGAPPSRTNPEGQPWGYRVFDPAQYREADGSPGAVVRFLRRRIVKLLEECDGLRVDHPHGLVCPWVYRDDDPDPFRAVRAGARLFESPALTDHPALAAYAIARPGQLAARAGVARHADAWVRELDDAQVDRYAALMAVIVDAVLARGGDDDEIVCEVLSTCPYPLARILERYGLGRFRVTQKANVGDPHDVYRSENAQPQDWIMVGNHDTPSLWELAAAWAGTPAGRDQAAYLARRLQPHGGADALAGVLASDPRRLAEARFADLFASPAAHVLVFFNDLLGLSEPYNRPGTVSEANWTLRVPPDYARHHAGRAARGEALNLPRVLAMALRARGGASGEHAGLAGELEDLARDPGGALCPAP